MSRCPRCGKPVPVDPDLVYCRECRPQLPYINPETRWVFDPILLAKNEGGYEWWDKCLIKVEKTVDGYQGRHYK